MYPENTPRYDNYEYYDDEGRPVHIKHTPRYDDYDRDERDDDDDDD